MLSIQTGDLWATHADGDWVVVTTNIGWDPEGWNNMGAGVALQAATRFRGLPQQYGELCRDLGAETPVTPHLRHRLFLFPVKPLNVSDPEQSWNQLADVALIERSTQQLAAHIDTLGLAGRVVMAFPGCGNGGLSRSVVQPILERYLSGRVRIVDKVSDHIDAPSAERALE